MPVVQRLDLIYSSQQILVYIPGEHLITHIVF